MRKFLAVLFLIVTLSPLYADDLPRPMEDPLPLPERKGVMDGAASAIVGVSRPLPENKITRGTGTVIAPVRKDGKSDILTADHCTGALGSKVDISLPGGKKLTATVAHKDNVSDLAWLVSDEPTGIFGATVAREAPPIGSPLWHRGLGVDRPGNHEVGRVKSLSSLGVSYYEGAGPLPFTSQGDSGAALFNEDGEVVFVHSGTHNHVHPVGALASLALKGRPGATLPAPEVPTIVSTPLSLPVHVSPVVTYPATPIWTVVQPAPTVVYRVVQPTYTVLVYRTVTPVVTRPVYYLPQAPRTPALPAGCSR